MPNDPFFDVDFIKEIQFEAINKISTYITLFLEHLSLKEKSGVQFNFADCSLGNILFSGAFLYCDRDFNNAIKEFSIFCHARGNVINITDGENFILSGLRENGDLLLDEASIVAPSKINVKEVFLLKSNLKSIDGQDKSNLEKMINDQKYPNISKVAEKILKEADIIIYGPGTQNSSLFPSYLTSGVCEAIQSNKNAAKIFISNIIKDNDIFDESVNSILRKFHFYMQRKNKVSVAANDLITHIFIQENNQNNSKAIPINKLDVEFEKIPLRITDWESQNGKHAAGVISDEIIRIAQELAIENLEDTHHLASIIVPCLNEIKTIKKALTDISRINFFNFDLDKEIIVVDSGSTDGSLEVIKSFSDIKIVSLPKGTKRGEAYQAGIDMAKGNIIVFYPSDDEYNVNDLDKIISPIIAGHTDFVIGSRSIKYTNVKKRILSIYQGKRIPYLISKFGGATLSILMLIFYDRYITDTLSTVKAFSRKKFKDMKLSGKTVDFDMQLIINFIKAGNYIQEVPVEFTPRMKKDGKKITLFDGLRSIYSILKG